MRRSTRPADIALYKSFSEPSFSPDGKRVVFSVRQANLGDDSYDSEVYVAEVKGRRVAKFTTGKKDSDPVWSPDGASILFTSKRGFAKDEKGSALYTISAEGGEARILTKSGEGVESPAWAPDSKAIFYLSRVVKREKDDVKVVRRPGYWFNGIGFTYNKRKHLFRVAASGGEPEPLTRGNLEVTAFAISNDGKRVAFLAATNDLKPYIADLFVINLRTGRRTKMTSSDKEIQALAWSPDDSRIAILANDLSAGFSSHYLLWVVNLRSGKVEKVDQTDRNKVNGLNSDVRAKAHGPNRILWDREGIYHLRADRGSVGLCKLRPDERGGGRPDLVIGGRRSVEGYDVRGGKVAFVAMSEHQLEEMYVSGGRERQLTHFNRGVYDEIEIAKQEHFTLRASDGETIEGWVMLPGTGRKVPGILYVHGGPKTAFGHSYMHEFQSLCGAGFAVVFLNPRGSDGYSESFADIRGHYGTRDYDDLMEGLSAALEQFPRIDGERLGVAGGSYGGYMTNWIVGHTDRFRAAVADRSIANWISMWTTSDIGPHFTTDQMSGDPWNAEEKLMADSPLRFAPNVKTPLLLVHSMEDYRCPVPEGIQFFTALKMLGKETELVLFPGENHDLSRMGKPTHRVARLEHYLRWFNAHLKPSS